MYIYIDGYRYRYRVNLNQSSFSGQGVNPIMNRKTRACSLIPAGAGTWLRVKG